MATKIVIGIDNSEHSVRAFHFYMDNIHRADYELVLVHAMEYPYIPGSQYVSKEAYDNIFKAARDSASKVEQKFEESCRVAKIKYTICKDFANPGEYVVKTAQDHTAKMIIMGTRGMGSIRRTILGSVSDYVVHHAHCPVLIARH